MPGQRLIVFDGNDLLELLKHYTAHSPDPIPIDAKLENMGGSATLQRWIGMMVKGAWRAPEKHAGGGMDPLHVRYTGSKVLTWGQRGEELKWHDAEDVKG